MKKTLAASAIALALLPAEAAAGDHFVCRTVELSVQEWALYPKGYFFLSSKDETVRAYVYARTGQVCRPAGSQNLAITVHGGRRIVIRF